GSPVAYSKSRGESQRAPRVRRSVLPGAEIGPPPHSILLSAFLAIRVSPAVARQVLPVPASPPVTRTQCRVFSGILILIDAEGRSHGRRLVCQVPSYTHQSIQACGAAGAPAPAQTFSALPALAGKP